MTAKTKSRPRREYGRGGLRERSAGSWELKVHATDPKTGRRTPKFYTFKGSRTDASRKLSRLIEQAAAGALPDDQKLFCSSIDAWERTLDVSLKTRERYLELARLHIRPDLGALKVRSITASRLEQFYLDLRKGRVVDGVDRAALSPRTIGHIHRLVSQILALEERDRVIDNNPARHAKRPKVEQTEIEILTEAQITAVLTKLRGRAIYPIIATALGTGMRRGELLALRWKDLELNRNDMAKLRVEQSLEQTKSGLRIKAPKTKRSRRTISVPDYLAAKLRAHWKAQQEQRLALGAGKAPEDSLVFPTIDGKPRSPNALTKEWSVIAADLGLKVSLHALRHTHASQLIAAGMDVLTISRRLGHSSATITLAVYGHLFSNSDDRAAQIMQTAFSSRTE